MKEVTRTRNKAQRDYESPTLSIKSEDVRNIEDLAKIAIAIARRFGQVTPMERDSLAKSEWHKKKQI
jgi:hypothetical protein